MILRPRTFCELYQLFLRRHTIELELLQLGSKAYKWKREHPDWTWQEYHPLPIGYRNKMYQLRKTHGEITRIINEALPKLHGDLSLDNDQWGRW